MLIVRQRPNKSLRQYVDRSRSATLEVLDLQVSIVVVALLQRTTFVPMKESLAFNQPTYLEDHLARANRHVMQMEILNTFDPLNIKEAKNGERLTNEGPNRFKKMT